jgi:uncharacterized protein YkwD
MGPLLRLVLLLVLATTGLQARADQASDELMRARARCAPNAPALQVRPQLVDAARRIAQGAGLRNALDASGYRAKRTQQWSLSGYRTPQDAARLLTQKHCGTFGSPELTDIGVYRRGDSWWIVAAAPLAAPPQEQAGDVAQRVLALVNQARSQARWCGAEPFQPAKPLALDSRLTQAAAVHAAAMAQGSFMEHEGRDGSTPAGRVSAAGYNWRSVGENIAMGQTTPEQVVAEWVKSPEHCANIMEPRFTQMGIAYAFEKKSEGGVYWAQTFGLPR